MLIHESNSQAAIDVGLLQWCFLDIFVAEKLERRSLLNSCQIGRRHMSELTSRYSSCRSRQFATIAVILFSATCLTVSLPAQDQTIPADEPGVLSLQRLSIRASSVYSFVPWKDLNASFDAVRDGFAYSATHLNPSGHVEHRLGDLSQTATISYRIIGDLHFVVQGLWTSGNTGFEVKEPTSGTVYSGNSVLTNPTLIYANTFDFRLRGWAVGAAMEVEMLVPLRLTLLLGRGFVHLDYRYSRSDEWEQYHYDALMENASGLTAITLETSVHISGPLSLSFGATYRAIQFPELGGDGMYRSANLLYGYEYSGKFQARLINAGAFYGIDVKGDWPAENYVNYILRAPWRNAPGPLFGAPPEAATLNLSGFGIAGGLVIAL